MKNKQEKAQVLSEALQNTDEGMLRQAYDTDSAEKFRLLSGKTAAVKFAKDRPVTNFRRYATAAACLAFAVCLALVVGSFAKNIFHIIPGPTDPTDPPVTQPPATTDPTHTTAPSTVPTLPTVPHDTLPQEPYDPSAPPLVLLTSDGQSLLPMMGGYSWSYIVDEVGYDISADGANPLSDDIADSIPWLYLDGLVLPFQFQIDPDSIMVRCWEIGNQGNENAYSEFQIASVVSDRIQLKSGAYIYEITGEWYFDADGYGKVTYVFAVQTTATTPQVDLQISFSSGEQTISDAIACLDSSLVYDDGSGYWVTGSGAGGYQTLIYTDWTAAEAYMPILHYAGDLQADLGENGKIDQVRIYFRSGDNSFGLEAVDSDLSIVSELNAGQWYVIVTVKWQGRYIEAQHAYDSYTYDYLFLLDVAESMAEPGICGENVTWVFNPATGTLTISGTGDMYTMDHAPWFDYRGRIKKVVIESGVTSIGGFSSLQYLTSVEIPATVTTIANNTFNGCTALTQIVLPDSVESIGSYAFSGCSSLVSINIPKSLTTISWGMLSDCRSLAQITLHEGITEIENYAFNDCVSLTQIVIPNSVKQIGGSAFFNCCNLSTITLGSNLTAISNNMFSYCTSLTEIILPDSLKAIEANAFNECSNLERIVIGPHVESVSYNAFYGCEKLQGFQLSKDNPHFHSDGTAIFNKAQTEILLMAPGYTGVYQIPNGVTLVKYWSFAKCPLSGVVIPDSVTTIGEYAFNDCVNMETVVLSNQLKVIEMRAFMSCKALKEVIFPASVEKIEYDAFAWCTGIQSVTFLGKLPEFGDSVFLNVTGFLYYPPNDEQWDHASQLPAPDMEWLPSTCIGGHTIQILPAKPETCTEDGLAEGKVCSVCGEVILFQQTISATGHELSHWVKVNEEGLYRRSCKNCDYAEEKTMDADTFPADGGFCGENLTWKYENGVLTISGDGFMEGYYSRWPAPWYAYSAVIHTVNLPEGLQYISEYAFAGLINLQQITIPDAVIGIGVHAFDGCASLTSVEIPDQVWNIDNEAFAYCTRLERVTIGRQVINIWLDAFVGCSALETVTFLGNMPYMEEAFRGLTFTIRYPAGDTSWTPNGVTLLDATVTWVAVETEP